MDCLLRGSACASPQPSPSALLTPAPPSATTSPAAAAAAAKRRRTRTCTTRARLAPAVTVRRRSGPATAAWWVLRDCALAQFLPILQKRWVGGPGRQHYFLAWGRGNEIAARQNKRLCCCSGNGRIKHKLRTNYADYAEIMQKLCRHYAVNAEIKQKLRKNYSTPTLPHANLRYQEALDWRKWTKGGS